MQFTSKITNMRMAGGMVMIASATVHQGSKVIAWFYPSLKKPSFRLFNRLALRLSNAS